MRSASVLWPLAAALASCGGASVPPEEPEAPVGEGWFVERAAELGLDFVHDSGAAGQLLMPEIMSGGAALFDADADGDLDAYLVQGGPVRGPREARPPNRLFANREGRFVDVTEASGTGDRGYGNGVACGDVHGDGRVDLYVTNLGPNVLFANRGGLAFEVAADSGAEDSGWGTSAAFFDADADGDLDLFVCNYLVWSPENELACVNVQGAPDYCSPASYESPAPDALLVNDGRGRFTDRSLEAGVIAVGTGLGVAVLDADEDGALDVFVANDGMPDRLWVNLGPRDSLPRFEDRAATLGVAVDGDGLAKAGMGVAVADIDRDGREDLLVGNLARESDSIFLAREGRFADSTRRLGMGSASKSFTRFGLGFHDFDRDGWLDLYQANGRVQLGDLSARDPFAEADLLVRGTPAGRFEPVDPRGGTVPIRVATGRAAAFGDVDSDGAIDVLVVNRDGPAELLVGRLAAVGDWIGFELLDRTGAPDLHARVWLETDAGVRTARSRAAYSYQASSDPRVHFGLEPEVVIGAARVRWSDGGELVLPAPEAGRWHRVRRE